ncbi:hypothetical protein POM88_042837 [Heracleum sosnowskyi]|uniref:Uncharacterized protein n=1 Tax=Heracleum sosnowskyi TaxID=360622 RepID=A0AAD8MB04_9APIA|nr:hypothetical protein POM88_042837 [Heracleum sosnowskyi]
MDRHTWMYEISRTTIEFGLVKEYNLARPQAQGTKRGREEDNMTNNEEDDVDIDSLEEMIQDMEDHFMHQPDILNSLVDDSKNLLKRRIVGIENIEDGEEYDQFDENHPFSIGLPTSNDNEIVDVNYLRNDHAEGLWIDRQV